MESTSYVGGLVSTFVPGKNPVTIDHIPTPMETYLHNLAGTGTDVTVSASDLNNVPRPIDFGAIRQALTNAIPGTYGISNILSVKQGAVYLGRNIPSGL